MNSQELESKPLLVGELGEGSLGPTLLLKTVTPRGARWLRGIFQTMRQASQPLLLTSRPEVGIPNVAIELICTGNKRPERNLIADGNNRFRWACTADQWNDLALLMTPLVEGAVGHQYLTSERWDDLLIEVSHGETTA